MSSKLWMLIFVLLGAGQVSGCALAVGAGAAIGADTVAEQDGDDGLF